MNEQSDTQSRIVRRDANVETVAAVRKAIKQAWLVDGDKTDVDADRLALAAIAALAQSDAEPHRDPDDTKIICPNCTHQFRAISVMDQARLAQSDAEPVRTAPETCPHCFNEEDCGQIELCSALAKGPQSDAEPVRWQWRYRLPPRGEWSDCCDERDLDFKAQYPDKYELRLTPPRPDTSAGLIEAAEWHDEQMVISEDIGSTAPSEMAQGYWEQKTIFHRDSARELRARAADRSGK